MKVFAITAIFLSYWNILVDQQNMCLNLPARIFSWFNRIFHQRWYATALLNAVLNQIKKIPFIPAINSLLLSRCNETWPIRRGGFTKREFAVIVPAHRTRSISSVGTIYLIRRWRTTVSLLLLFVRQSCCRCTSSTYYSDPDRACYCRWHSSARSSDCFAMLLK